MDAVTLICPQCGAPLPRRALWRAVACTYCAAEVTPVRQVVQASRFREAYLRSRADSSAGLSAIACGGHHYRILTNLAHGARSRVVLADRLGALPARMVLKIARADAPAGSLRREKEILDALQACSSADAAYFTQRLPQPVAFGMSEDAAGGTDEVLVLRNPTGFWGSLADVRSNYPTGIDPRHAVWMWRRILDVLAFVHTSGWAHGRLGPDHLLVHPADHGVLIIGWAEARQYRLDRPGAICSPARDLMQAAWTIRAMLSRTGWDLAPTIPASTPRQLAALLARASEDVSWCASVGAAGLDEQLVSAARAAFGSPRYLDFTPVPQLQEGA
jgi:hypothetical protein